MKRKALLSCLLVLAVLGAQAQTADEILNKYFAKTGGVDKWKGIMAMKMEAKASTAQGDFPLTIFQKAPNKSKTVVSIQGQELVQQAYDGQTAWALNPFGGGVVKLDAEQTKELADEQVEVAFIDYKKKGHAVTLEGKEEVGGVQCYKIKLEKNKNNDKDDATEIHYFDVDKYLRVMQTRYIKSGPAKGMELQIFMSDYKEVNGLMMPFTLEQKVNGQNAATIVITKIEVNENIDDSVFAYPGK